MCQRRYFNETKRISGMPGRPEELLHRVSRPIVSRALSNHLEFKLRKITSFQIKTNQNRDEFF